MTSLARVRATAIAARASTSRRSPPSAPCRSARRAVLKETGVETSTLSERLTEAGQAAKNAGLTLSAGLTVPLVAIGAAAIKAAIDFESSFTGVLKTVDATEEEFAMLSDGFRQMASEIPLSVNELNRIGEAAGQLGIETAHILGFTEVMAALGVTTNLSADQAATQLARFANITQMAQDDFDRLGSAIVHLGNNFATTEAEIVEMGLRLAGAGTQIDLSEAEVLGFAAALSSVGIEAEAGGTAFSRVFVDMASAVASGNEKLEAFASIAGMTTEEFSRLFREDAAEAVITFVEGLGLLSAEGENVFAVLDDVELSNVRVRDALLRASGAGDLMREAVAGVTGAWEGNIALTKESELRYATTASQLQLLWNRVNDVAITLGGPLARALTDVTDQLDPVIDLVADAAEWFADADPAIQSVVIGVGGIAAAAGPVLFFFGSLVESLPVLIKAFTLLGGPTVLGGLATLLSGPAGLIALVLGLSAALKKLVPEEQTQQLAEYGKQVGDLDPVLTGATTAAELAAEAQNLFRAATTDSGLAVLETDQSLREAIGAGDAYAVLQEVMADEAEKMTGAQRQQNEAVAGAVEAFAQYEAQITIAAGALKTLNDELSRGAARWQAQPEEVGSLADALMNMGQQITISDEALKTLNTTGADLWRATSEGLTITNEEWAAWRKQLEDTPAQVVVTFGTLFDSIAATGQALVGLGQTFGGSFGVAIQGIGNAIGAFGGLHNAVGQVYEGVRGLGQTFSQMTSGGFGGFLQGLPSLLSGIGGIASAAMSAVSLIGSLAGAIAGLFTTEETELVSPNRNLFFQQFGTGSGAFEEVVADMMVAAQKVLGPDSTYDAQWALVDQLLTQMFDAEKWDQFVEAQNAIADLFKQAGVRIEVFNKGGIGSLYTTSVFDDPFAALGSGAFEAPAIEPFDPGGPAFEPGPGGGSVPMPAGDGHTTNIIFNVETINLGAGTTPDMASTFMDALFDYIEQGGEGMTRFRELICAAE